MRRNCFGSSMNCCGRTVRHPKIKAAERIPNDETKKKKKTEDETTERPNATQITSHSTKQANEGKIPFLI